MGNAHTAFLEGAGGNAGAGLAWVHMSGVVAGSGVENKQQYQDFLGNGIELGKTYQTTDRATGKPVSLNVTNERAGRWLDNFRTMKERGVRVPVCYDHVVDARNSVGRLLDLKIEQRQDGNGSGTGSTWIRPLFRVVGADAIPVAARNELSLGIRPNMRDGEGNEYDEAIYHVAITPIPVVGNQQGVIAASRAAHKSTTLGVAELAGSVDEPTVVFNLSNGDNMGAEQTTQTTGTTQATQTQTTVAGTNGGAGNGGASNASGGVATLHLSTAVREALLSRLPETLGCGPATNDEALLNVALSEFDNQRQDLHTMLAVTKRVCDKNEVLLSRVTKAENDLQLARTGTGTGGTSTGGGAGTGTGAGGSGIAVDLSKGGQLRDVLMAQQGAGTMQERHARLEQKANMLLSKDYGWSPAAVNDLKAKLLGTSDTINVYNLSKAATDTVCPADGVLDVLLTYKPDPSLLKVGTYEMSRVDPRTQLDDAGATSAGSDPYGLKTKKKKSA